MRILVNDVDFYYERYGKGLPVVMIHGWSPDHRILKNCMEPVFQHFPDGFERVYLDLPGMGRTAGGDGIHSSDDMAERLCGFIDAVLPGRELALVGESYGGYLARGVVARRPGSILGLCLVCPVANPQTQKENSPPFAVLEKDPGIDSLLGDDDRRYFSGISVRQTASTLIRFREEVLPGLKLADHEWIAGHIAREVPFRKDVDEPGARHAFPALFLAGRQDNCVGYSDLWRLMEIYPRASYCALDMAGHNLQIEQPHLFASLAQEWLERVMFESGRKAEGASR